MTIRNALANGIYNLDRMAASFMGAPDQETMSSQCGRALNAGHGGIKPVVANVLNYFFPGHTDAAIRHADALNHADSGFRG